MEETPTALLGYAENSVVDPTLTHQLSAYLGSRAVPFIDALLDDLPQLLQSMRDARTHYRDVIVDRIDWIIDTGTLQVT